MRALIACARRVSISVRLAIFTGERRVCIIADAETTLSAIFASCTGSSDHLQAIESHPFRQAASIDQPKIYGSPGSLEPESFVFLLPRLPDRTAEVEAMIANPWETQSDSFYFAEDTLIMHNKASYKYIPEDKAQAKKSYEVRAM